MLTENPDLTDKQIKEELEDYTKRNDKPFTQHEEFLEYFLGGDLPKMMMKKDDSSKQLQKKLVGVAALTTLFLSCLFSVHNMVTRS